MKPATRRREDALAREETHASPGIALGRMSERLEISISASDSALSTSTWTSIASGGSCEVPYNEHTRFGLDNPSRRSSLHSSNNCFDNVEVTVCVSPSFRASSRMP